MKKLAILGAGPIGLEAALAARRHGYAVEIFELGTVAASVRRWGHVRMFSPFVMNASKAGVERLAARGFQPPPADALLTGGEYAERYLDPLARCLDVPLHTGTKVVSVARTATLKTEKIGAAERAETPFRLLIRQQARERYETADVVFDCTGTFLNPNPVGDGGQPALGESSAARSICYGVPRPGSLPGGRLLVVGGGHSAATAVRDLVAKGKEVAWVRRRETTTPYLRIPNDPLTARDQLAAEVNALCASGQVSVHSGATVESISLSSGPDIVAQLRGGVSIMAQHIVCATGFRPDLQLARELQVQTCWATEGTYPLAASLLGEAGGDCLAIPAKGADTLRHPEPGYFALGIKSYGRTPDFLIRTGLAQIDTLLELLSGRMTKL